MQVAQTTSNCSLVLLNYEWKWPYLKGELQKL